MRSNGIEDIMIENGYKTKKKKNTGLKIVLIFLFLILALFIGAYYYFTNINTISAKDMFVTNISKLNVRELLQADIYKTTIEKIESKDFETNTNVNFTTTLRNDELKNVDVSKLALEIFNKNDVDNSKSFSEAILKYAENEVFRLKSLSNENSIALFSNEINDKYVGCNYENIQKTLDIDYDYKNTKKLKDAEKIDLTEEEGNKYIEKYFSKIIENIPEEKFGVQENIVIKKAEETVDVTAYTVNLNKDELNQLIKDFLTEIKDDTELLKEFAGVEKSENNVENIEQIVEENSEFDAQPEIIPEEQIPEEIITENNIEAEENQGENPTEVTTEEVTNGEENQIPVITINPVGTVVPVEINEEEKNIITEVGTEDAVENENTISNKSEENLGTENLDTIILLQRLICGKKLDMTVEEIQELIKTRIEDDEYYQVENGQEDKGLVINVYASEEKTEKITIEFPNESSLDIEIVNKSDKENGIKATYLQKEENQMNGFSLDFNKVQNDANTTINATYNVIENEKINKKIILDLKTDGTVNSKELTSDIILTISTSEGETKIVIDNTIKFIDIEGLEELTEEKCLYLDQLSEEELNTTLEDLKSKIQSLYNTKKENLNFINTNTGGITLEDISSTVTREDAKNALITRVSNMMQEAIDKSQEFTIKNLENLTIDGYEVSSTVTEENAIIVVDTYTFNIDQNFTLTDAE